MLNEDLEMCKVCTGTGWSFTGTQASPDPSPHDVHLKRHTLSGLGWVGRARPFISSMARAASDVFSYVM